MGQNHIEANSDSIFFPPEGVFKKVLSISPFFSKLLKNDLNLLFLLKHHLEEIREDINKKNNQNYHWQDTCGKKYYLLFLSKLVFAKLQIKPKSKSNQTKNLERLYIWVVVCSLFVRSLFVVCRNAGHNLLIPF